MADGLLRLGHLEAGTGPEGLVEVVDGHGGRGDMVVELEEMEVLVAGHGGSHMSGDGGGGLGYGEYNGVAV